MKITRFMFTVPLALALNALTDLVIAVLAIVSALILIPVILTKDFANGEIAAEKKREFEMLRKKYQEEVERIMKEGQPRSEDSKESQPRSEDPWSRR